MVLLETGSLASNDGRSAPPPPPCTAQYCVVEGRPFLVAGQQRLSDSIYVNEASTRAWMASDATVGVAMASAVVPNTTVLRQLLAAHWERAAAAEHASVAAFSRHSLQLMALAAPRWLVQQSHEAALDEIRHAQMAYTLASLYGGAAIGPGPLNITGAMGIQQGRELAEQVIALTVRGAPSHSLTRFPARPPLARTPSVVAVAHHHDAV